MRKHAALAVVLTLAVVAPGAAQQAPAKPPESAPPPSAPTAKGAPSAVNVRLELTITDQRGDVPVAPKTVTVLVGDQQNGRVRTGNGNTTLNVDVRPEIVREGRIKTTLSLEYTPRATDADKTTPMAISESLGVLLDDGKPVLVSQTADPGSDRKVRVEVKATIVR